MRDKVRRSGAWWLLVVGLGGGMGMDGALCLGLYLSHTHTHVGGGRARRQEVHARCMYSRLFPNHTRVVTRWSSFLYEKGSPRGNLARVLVHYKKYVN